MQINLRSHFLLIISVMFFFVSACKKTETVKKTKDFDHTEMAKTLAINLNKSFTDNLDTTAVNGVASTNGKKTSSLHTTSTQCGETRDSVVDVSLNIADVSYTEQGFVKLTYLCDQSNWNTIGYHLKDSVHRSVETPTTHDITVVQNDYDAIAQNYQYGRVTVNGKQKSHYYRLAKFTTPRVSDQFNDFVLSNVVVAKQPTIIGVVPVILSGDAAFNLHCNQDDASYAFSGTITFKGNFTVHVAFLGEKYQVNTLYGTVTKI